MIYRTLPKTFWQRLFRRPATQVIDYEASAAAERNDLNRLAMRPPEVPEHLKPPFVKRVRVAKQGTQNQRRVYAAPAPAPTTSVQDDYMPGMSLAIPVTEAASVGMAPAFESGGGGQFDGGGASGHWDTGPSSSDSGSCSSSSYDSGSSSSSYDSGSSSSYDSGSCSSSSSD